MEAREREAQLDYLINRAAERAELRRQRASTVKSDIRPSTASGSIFPWAPSTSERQRRPTIAGGERDGDGLAPIVTVASFIDSLGVKSKKTAMEKDLMWDELLRRSDQAPGGTIHAQVPSSLPSNKNSEAIETQSILTDLDSSNI